MKYYLSLNLKEFHELAPSLDIYDVVILDYIRDMCVSQDPRIIAKRITDDDGNFWTWISYQHLLNELPFLKKINSKSSISKIISNLIKVKFIETKHFDGYKLYVKISHKVDKLVYSSVSLEKSQSFPTETLERESFSRETNHIDIDIDNIDNKESSINKESISKSTTISEPEHKKALEKQNLEDDIQRIFKNYIEKILPGSRLTKRAKDKIKTRLKEFSVDDILKGIDNFSEDDWWMTHNARRGIAWFFHSEDRTEQFRILVPRTKTPDKEKLRNSKYS